jgi:5-methylcytosine-specific restriction protein A
VEPPGWRTVRREVLDRDRCVCWICGGRAADTVDHLTPKSAGGSDDPANLAAIHDRTWPHCHRKKTILDRTAMAQQWSPARYREAIEKLRSDQRECLARGTGDPLPRPAPP